jgi:CheY-like chemotaxis protein
LRQITAEIALKPIRQHAEPRGKRILVAEDEKFVRMLVRAVLHGAGYTIIEALDGEDAILKIRNSQEGMDLLLLDLDMPKKNGRKVCDEIKRISPDIKVLFTSAYPAEIMRERGLLTKILTFSKTVWTIASS